ncbi:RNA polymerase sigma factor [Streptomyces filamentosus]|uniref:RNA polymerase sigma factor n=1 Tax=Streptomyces filamentosus TaxID=67294 RepID=UPI0036EDB37A
MTETSAPATVAPSPSARPRAASRCPGDFAAFYTTEMTKVTVFLMNLGASPYEAADAAHEAFLSVLPDRWRTLEHPRAYLRTVAHRKYLRQTTTRALPTDPVPDRPGGTCPVELLVLSDEQQRLLGLLAALPSAEREAMAWKLDGFSHEETATSLGKNPAAVRQAYGRARVRLKRALGLKGEVAADA